MYFLNGDRTYIKPRDGRQSMERQLDDCLSRLDEIDSGKRLFKLNFFADTPTEPGYRELQAMILRKAGARFGDGVICSLIAQPPLTCRILAEASFYDPSEWTSELIRCNHGSAMLFHRSGARVLAGHVQSQRHAEPQENAEVAFGAFQDLLTQGGVPVRSVIRQWNYIEHITGRVSGRQTYQVFNDVRARFYGNHFEGTGFPAATGIGMSRGGIIIEFVAVDAPEAVSLPVDNPVQVAAHDYSEAVLVGEGPVCKATPKFERARYLELFGKKQIFISGTASIRGEQTVGIGDPEEQTRVTIDNMVRLYSGESLKALSEQALEPVYGHARVYVKNRKDYFRIRNTFWHSYGALPVVYIQADICRDELLVEIEGKVIFK